MPSRDRAGATLAGGDKPRPYEPESIPSPDRHQRPFPYPRSSSSLSSSSSSGTGASSTAEGSGSLPVAPASYSSVWRLFSERANGQVQNVSQRAEATQHKVARVSV